MTIPAMTAPVEQQKKKLELNSSRQFGAWLTEVGCSLAFTTYQAGKVFLIGTKEDSSLAIHERSLERCMGMAYQNSSLYISSLYQVWRFENFIETGQKQGAHDALFVPQSSSVTGDIDIHDMALGADGRLNFVCTLFNCIGRLSDTASFEPLWKPPFISKYAAEDRCHLNGMAADETGPRYVTAVSRSDAVDGWRDYRKDGGVIVDVQSNAVVATGLSMPHSPRLYRGKLWVLNSGTGQFGIVDPETGRFDEVAFCTGYARGLSFIGKYAVIGLSKPRDNKTFQGLALDDALAAKQVEPRCGLMVVDLDTGDTVHWLHIDGIVSELYDVTLLPGIKNPAMIGFKSDEIRRVIKISGDNP